MAPIILARDEADSARDGTLAFYLFVAFVIFFGVAFVSMISLAVMRGIKRRRQSQAFQTHGTISIINEKSAFLDSPPQTPTSVPEIRITFPEEQGADGKRHSRIVVVKIGEKGSVGYSPYQEPLPVYKEKESPQFTNLDLERIGGLKEKNEKP